MADNKKRKLKLEQVRDGYNRIDEELYKAEVGDKVGNYKVVEVEKVECDHPKRNWHLDNQHSEHIPIIMGTCTVCGDTREIDVYQIDGELQKDERE